MPDEGTVEAPTQTYYCSEFKSCELGPRSFLRVPPVPGSRIPGERPRLMALMAEVAENVDLTGVAIQDIQIAEMVDRALR